VDAALNIAEGTGSRTREAYAPVLLEMAGIPYLGSDALTLSLSLDKAWTKDLASAADVPTPAYRIFHAADDITAASLPAGFPLFVKPRYEGSSKGITPASKVVTFEEARSQITRLCTSYGQDALVESFVSGGGEFTVAVIGHDPPEALPVLQRAVERETRIGLHALDRRGFEQPELTFDIEGVLTPELEQTLQRYALAVFRKLECLDFARIDFRVDAEGVPWFLEINPLPTFAPDGTFAILAELMGQPYPDFLARTLQKGFQRLGL
jgi:D-alanine-D-alanine ligase